MNTYYNNDTGLTTRVSYGNEIELPQDTDIVQMTYYAANNVIEIVKQSIYSGELHRCHDVKELVYNLTKKEQRKRKANKQSSIDKN